MTDRFADRYRIKSTRLPEWDYSYGDYFITICTKDRECYFGDIINGDMRLNELGDIANEEIQNTYRIRENVVIDEYIIMPDHIHMIMCIEKRKKYQKRRDALYASHKGNENKGNENKGNENKGNENKGDGCKSNKGDGCKPSLQDNNNVFGPQKDNLASIIRGLKGSITSKIKKINKEFGWQSRYHEHVIRSEKELNAIREYIQNNPLSWDIKKNDSDLFL